MKKYSELFILIVLSFTLMVFIPNVKAADITKNGITYNEDFYFPSLADFTCSDSRVTNCLMVEIEDRWSYNYNYQCWYMFTNGQSEVVCYVSNNSFVPYLHWRNGQGTNQYNPDGFYIDGYSWINSSNTNNYYKSIGIFRWNSENFNWDTICWEGNNNCQYFPNSTPYIFPMAFYSSVPSNKMTPIFKTDIWYTSDRWDAPYFQGFDLNTRPIGYEIPTIENNLFVDGEDIKLNYKITQWEDSRITYLKTGPLLQKTYTRQEYLENNEFSIIVRFPQQNYLINVEFYNSSDTKVDQYTINLRDLLESMPQDQANEIIAQEEYQKDIYNWYDGNYYETMSNTIEDSSLVINWARELMQYLFNGFPTKVKYAIISIFIGFIIACIIRMIWR